MRVSAMCDCVQTTLDQLIAQCLCVQDDLLDVVFELRAQSLAKRYCFCSNHMHQGTTLNTGKNCRVEFFRQRFVICDDHSTAWTAQGFMRRRRCNMRMGEGRWMLASGDEAREMRHVHMQICINHIRNFTHTLEINLTRDRGTTCDDHFWLMLFRERFHLIVIQKVVFFAYTVLNGVEPLT